MHCDAQSVIAVISLIPRKGFVLRNKNYCIVLYCTCHNSPATYRSSPGDWGEGVGGGGGGRCVSLIKFVEDLHVYDSLNHIQWSSHQIL